MSYRIDYEQRQRGAGKKHSLRRFLMTLACLLLFFWTVGTYWPEGQDMLRILLIPGDPDATLKAAQTFAQELSSGFSLPEAAASFCEAVLSHGNPG